MCNLREFGATFLYIKFLFSKRHCKRTQTFSLAGDKNYGGGRSFAIFFINRGSGFFVAQQFIISWFTKAFFPLLRSHECRNHYDFFIAILLFSHASQTDKISLLLLLNFSLSDRTNEMKIHLRIFSSFVFNIVMDFEINHVSDRLLMWPTSGI